MYPVIEALSDADLLGLMVGQRTAQRLLKDAGGSITTLLNDRMAHYHIESKVSNKLKAARELVRRSLREALSKSDYLNSPASVREYLRVVLLGRDYEVFLVLFLDAQNRVIASEEMFRGTLTMTSVYPREIVKRCLYYNCAAAIFAHNHPSGLEVPSHADETLTQALKSALTLVDVKVLDHFIVAGNGILSFAERGLL